MSLKVQFWDLSFNPENDIASVKKLEECVNEIRIWMASNFLKLNDDKTELIFLGTPANLKKLSSSSVQIGNCEITSSPKVRNIGAIFHENLRMEAQVAATCKAAWCKLYQIGKIRPYLTVEETKSIVHAFITSKLDQNNSLPIGCPDYLIKRL